MTSCCASLFRGVQPVPASPPGALVARVAARWARWQGHRPSREALSPSGVAATDPLVRKMDTAAAAGLSYVGGYVMNTYRSYDNFVQDKHALLPAVIILCVAAVMFIIGLLGCCATFRESRVGLGLFLAIILIIFIAEVSAFVLAFVYREKVKTDVQGTMRSVFEKYDGRNSQSAVVDYLQENLHCCGVKNYSDWTSTRWFNSTGNNSVPLSCCKQNLKNCTGSLDQPQELNTQGCSGELESGLQSVISYAMLVILGFAIVKFFAMLSVCVLTCKREDSGYQPLYSGVFA